MTRKLYLKIVLNSKTNSYVLSGSNSRKIKSTIANLICSCFVFVCLNLELKLKYLTRILENFEKYQNKGDSFCYKL